jgi:hypothetical protein
MTDATRESLVHQMVAKVESVLRSSAAISEAERRLAPEAMNVRAGNGYQ